MILNQINRTYGNLDTFLASLDCLSARDANVLRRKVCAMSRLCEDAIEAVSDAEVKDNLKRRLAMLG